MTALDPTLIRASVIQALPHMVFPKCLPPTCHTQAIPIFPWSLTSAPAHICIQALLMLQYCISAQHGVDGARLFSHDTQKYPNCVFHKEKIHASRAISSLSANSLKRQLKASPIIPNTAKVQQKSLRILPKDAPNTSPKKDFQHFKPMYMLAPSVHHLAIWSGSVLQD